MSFVARYMEKLTALEALAVGTIARIAPWLPLLPTAWLVYDRAVRYLSWPWWVALAAGVAVECLGLLTTLTALELYTYNREKLASEGRAPLAIPIALAVVYLLIAELLTLGLDLAPRLVAGEPVTVAGLAPACFPPLSLVGMILLAVRADQQARLAENAAAKEARRQARNRPRKVRESSADLAKSHAVTNVVTVNDSRKNPDPRDALTPLDRDRLSLLRAIYEPGGQFTRSDAEAVLGLKSTAASNLISRLVFLGLVRVGGEGRRRRYWFTLGGQDGT